MCKVAVDISHHLLTKVARVLHFLYCGFIFLATTEHKCPTTLFCYILLETYQISATKAKLQSAEDAMAWSTFMDEIFDLPTIARPTILLALPTHVLGG